MAPQHCPGHWLPIQHRLLPLCIRCARNQARQPFDPKAVFIAPAATRQPDRSWSCANWVAPT
jgi:hypothetical protein